MKSVVDSKTGKVLFLVLDGVEIDILEGQVLINSIPNGEYINPFYNFDMKEFYNV